MAKLKETDVAIIKERLSKGERGVALSLEYGVCQQTISNIKHGKKWLKEHDNV